MQFRGLLTALAVVGAGAFVPQAGVGSMVRRLETPGRLQPLWGKPKLSDMLGDLDEDGEGGVAKKASADAKPAPQEPEVVFYQGPPAKAEIIGPALSIITIIGVVPFSAALARQAWVRYTISSRRVRVESGYQGKDETEIIYSDIRSMKYAWRAFGAAGDLVLELRDGARIEMRSVPDFETVYKEMYSRLSEDAQEESAPMK